MIKYIILFFLGTLFFSCKYREHKASYSIVEVDSVMIDNEDAINEIDIQNLDEVKDSEDLLKQ